MMTARSCTRVVVEQIVIGCGFDRIARRWHRRDAIILAYHNIVPDGELCAGDRSLHLSRDAFARQLDVLSQSHDVVPLRAALGATDTSSVRPAAAITFDDAYAGAVTVGVAELARRGLPATIFVTPAFLDGRPFWWDALSVRHAGELMPALRERALIAHHGDAEDVLAEADPTGELAAGVPEYARGSAMRDLTSAARVPGITLASHTWSHANLAALEASRLAEELTRPLDWLRARFENVLPYISYPYGLSSRQVENAAAAARYEAGFRISGGWLRSGARSPFALPRVNVPAGASIAGFQLRAAGLVP